MLPNIIKAWMKQPNQNQKSPRNFTPILLTLFISASQFLYPKMEMSKLLMGGIKTDQFIIETRDKRKTLVFI